MVSLNKRRDTKKHRGMTLNYVSFDFAKIFLRVSAPLCSIKPLCLSIQNNCTANTISNRHAVRLVIVKPYD